MDIWCILKPAKTTTKYIINCILCLFKQKQVRKTINLRAVFRVTHRKHNYYMCQNTNLYVSSISQMRKYKTKEFIRNITI